MNAPNPILAKQTGHGVRQVVLVFAVVLAGILSFPLVQRFYFLQELLFFVGLALLAMFLVVNLIILGLLFRRAWRFVLDSVPRGRTSQTTGQQTLKESHNGSFVSASSIATEVDSGSV